MTVMDQGPLQFYSNLRVTLLLLHKKIFAHSNNTPCTPRDVSNTLPGPTNQALYSWSEARLLAIAAKECKENHHVSPNAPDFPSLLFGGKNRMRVYDLKKREKALLFLTQKMAQLGLVAYFAT